LWHIKTGFLTATRIIGRHGQELVDEGHARVVLRLVGETLRRLQSIDPTTVPALDGDGPVVVHGDFGPQNMLFELEADRVMVILDWESAHRGAPVEDLAWAEWIVRMHHRGATDSLGELFDASGLSISWALRQEAMVRQCADIHAYCLSAGWDRAATEWADRLHRTEQWRDS
jgi:aminoglycoside phosphotransferase (APT) family kinase protein